MIEDGLYDRLNNHAGLTALVSDRIYPNHLPQAEAFPSVAYRKTSSRPKALLATNTDVYDTSFDLGCFAKSYDAANNVAEQVVGALERYSGTNAGVVILDCMIDSISNDYEVDLEIFEVSITVSITHRGL